MSDERALVPTTVATPIGNGLPDWWRSKHGDVPCITTIPNDGSEHSRTLLFEHLQAGDSNAEERINTEFTIVDYTCYPGSRLDDDGQVQEFVRTVMSTDAGGLIVCGSAGIAKSIGLIVSLLMGGEWRPGLKVKLVARKLGNGHNWYELKPLSVPKSKSAAKK